MKQLCIAILSLILIMQLIGCTSATAFSDVESSISSITVATSSTVKPASTTASISASETTEEHMIDITLKVGAKEFSATLIDSEAVQAFVKYLPMTVKMEDLNGQEQYYALASDLPASSSERPSTIYNGDIMCWSGNTLVLFYATFPNSYGGYVRLGAVDDPDGLAAMLGAGSAEVTWTLTG